MSQEFGNPGLGVQGLGYSIGFRVLINPNPKEGLLPRPCFQGILYHEAILSLKEPPGRAVVQ